MDQNLAVKQEIERLFVGLPIQDQQKVVECVAKIEALLKEYGEHGVIAMSWAGAKRAVEANGNEILL